MQSNTDSAFCNIDEKIQATGVTLKYFCIIERQEHTFRNDTVRVKNAWLNFPFENFKAIAYKIALHNRILVKRLFARQTVRNYLSI